MSDFKYHIGHRFGSCRLIANARDPHRNRDVKLYHIPGEFDYVGVNDGIDSWICPAIADPFSAGVKRLLDDIRAGKTIEVANLGQAKRRAVVRPQMELPLQPPAEPVKERRRAILASPEPMPAQTPTEQRAVPGRRRVHT